MNLLAPSFAVAGLLLAAIPILIHILNRRRYREQQWAAMEFLLRAMRKNRRRLRFEQWILLAVRCAVLSLLGLALARPTGCDSTALSQLARQSSLHVLVIDNSYSMAYEADRTDAATHLAQAKKVAGALLGAMTPGGDSVAVVTASSPARVVFPVSYDLEAARAAVERIEQSYAATDLPNALRLSSQVAREATTVAGRELDVLSDGTRSSLELGGGGGAGGLTTGLRDAAKEAAGSFSRFTFHRLGLGEQSHAVPVSLSADASVVTTRQPQRFRAQIAAYGRDVPREVVWRLDDQLLPGGNVVASGEAEVSQVKMSRAGARVLSVQLGGSSERLKLDQTRYRVVDAMDRVRVLIVEGERGGGPLSSSAAFLRIALAPPASPGGPNVTGSGAPATSSSIFDPDVISDLELGNKSLAEYRAVVLCGIAQVPEETARQLDAFVRAGGTVVTFMGEGVSPESYNATMAPRGLIPGPLVKRVTVGSGGNPSETRGATLDFNPQSNLHPMLRVFRNESRSGLDTAEIFTYWQTDLAAASGAGTRPSGAAAQVERVLDFAGSKDPAITLTSLGQGKAVFVATSAGADGWTTLPAKPVFVTLMQEMLSTALSARDVWMTVTVGQPLELPAWLTLAGTPALSEPGGGTSLPGLGPLSSDHGVWRSAPLARPGVYVLSGLAPSSVHGASLPVAVNVDAASEADVRTLDSPAISRALGDVPVEVVGDEIPSARLAEREDRGADYGWILMLALLAALTCESWLAMRFGHHSR